MAKQKQQRPRAQATQPDTETPQDATPVAPPTETPAPDAPAQDDPLAGLSDDGAEPFVETLLTQARDLDDRKAALYQQIDANRTTLRTVQTTGLLSEKQSKAIDLFYPKRQAKAKDTETTTPTAA